MTIRDSYLEFLNQFDINIDTFFEWGVANTIFPPVGKVEQDWDNLKRKIFNNERVYIREYGRDAKGTDLYKNLYSFLFENYNVIKDPSNNTAPQKTYRC